VEQSPGALAGTLIPRFEAWYFETRGRTERTETTWETDYWEVYKRIAPEARLTQDLLEELIRRTKPNSRSRKRYCQAIKKLIEFGELNLNLRRIQELKGSYSSGSVEPKTLLTDEEIEQIWAQIDEPWLRLCFGYLVTFGLRNHELYYIDNQDLLAGGHTIVIGRNTKSKRQRVAYALPRRWIEQFELRQELTLKPKPGKTNRRLGEVFSQAFLSRNLPSPYTFRHCWRERAIRLGVDPSVAAKSLGHSVSVSQQHYTAWISEKTCDLAFERAEEMGRNAGSVPQS
jgi:integrase